MVGYACKKRGLWGTGLPLFFDSPYECRKWAQTNRRDNVNGFVPVEPMKAGVYYHTKHSTLYFEGDFKNE